jgi:protein phosphatase
MEIRYVSAGATHRGTARPINEDSLLDLPALGVWAVADGMGGHHAGDYASNSVVRALESVSPAPVLATLVERVRHEIAATNANLYAIGAQRGRSATVGTTVAVLVALGDQASCLWAGDSRIYLFRSGVLRQLTRDHTKAEALIKHGLLDATEARHHEAGNIVTRAVGAEEVLRLDRVDERVQPGDLFLLCTDGLTKFVDDPDIVAALRRKDCKARADALIASGLAKGTRDNITALVIEALQ